MHGVSKFLQLANVNDAKPLKEEEHAVPGFVNLFGKDIGGEFAKFCKIGHTTFFVQGCWEASQFEIFGSWEWVGQCALLVDVQN